VADSGLNVALREKELKIVEERSADFEILGNIRMLLEIFDRKGGEQSATFEHRAQAGGRFGIHFVIRLNASAAFDDASAIGAKLGFLIRIGSGCGKGEFGALERPLYRASAGRVVKSRGERHAGGLG